MTALAGQLVGGVGRSLREASTWRAAGLMLGLLVGACGGAAAKPIPPTATLGATPESEGALRPLVRRWSLGTTSEREALEPELAAFCRKYAHDPLVRLALVLRGFNALARSELGRARALAQGHEAEPADSPLSGPAGATRDLASLLVGVVERREGRPVRALARLRPLLHKLLDDFAIEMLDEELVRAAIDAKRWAEALSFIEAWRAEGRAGTNRHLDRTMTDLMAVIPARALLSELEARAGGVTDSRDDKMAQAIAQRLAIIAVSNNDLSLARRLLSNHQALLGRYGEAVARLAVTTAQGSVQASTVGLLLSLESLATRRRSADAVAGVAFGLDVRHSQARLVTRDAGPSRERVHRAMAELAAQGAAVIIAGLDPGHALHAASFARANRVPVILLSVQPGAWRTSSGFVFLAGAQPERTHALLARELRGRGADVLALIGAQGASPENKSAAFAVSYPCDALPTGATLAAKKVQGLIVQDGAYCGELALELARGADIPAATGLGVSGGAGRLSLAAGVFPTGAKPAPQRLDSWLARGLGPPTWWAAVGRDAAVLALSAVEHLGAADAAEEDEVAQRRLQAATALAQARAPLWSSDARGFDRSLRLPRKVTVRGGRRGKP